MSVTDTQLVGMEKQAALDLCKTEGIPVRVEREDGQQFMLTMDYRMDRVNLSVNGGKVTGTRRG